MTDATTDSARQAAFDELWEKARQAGHQQGFTEGFSKGFTAGTQAVKRHVASMKDPSDTEVAELINQAQTASTSPEHRLPLSTSIEDLKFPTRVNTCLERSQIRTIGDLVQYAEWQLFDIKNLGRRGIEEIQAKLDELGYSLRPS